MNKLSSEFLDKFYNIRNEYINCQYVFKLPNISFKGIVLNGSPIKGKLIICGITYIGTFINYKLHGDDCCIDNINTNQLYIGEFKNGMFVRGQHLDQRMKKISIGVFSYNTEKNLPYLVEGRKISQIIDTAGTYDNNELLLDGRLYDMINKITYFGSFKNNKITNGIISFGETLIEVQHNEEGHLIMCKIKSSIVDSIDKLTTVQKMWVCCSGEYSEYAIIAWNKYFCLLQDEISWTHYNLYSLQYIDLMGLNAIIKNYKKYKYIKH